MFLETFYEYCDSGLHTVKYCLLDQMVQDIKGFKALSVLDSRTYERFNLRIKQTLRTTSQRRGIQMMESVHVMEGNYDRAPPSWKEEFNGKSR